MTQILKKLKLLSTGALALSFLMAVTLSSCDAKKESSDETETVEEHSAGEEHPAGGEEHPAGEEEHPTDGEHEHPSDSTAAEGDEHPVEASEE